MKIKMTASLVGPEYSLDAGETTDRFDSAEAIRFIEAGFAVPVAEEKIERAVAVLATEKRKGK
jgi:hypothetical protein